MPSSQIGRASARPEGSSRSSTVVLAIILGAQAMAVIDSSVVTTALPSIHAALHFSPTGLSWVQSAYTLAFGGLLMLGARAGDLLGRRRVFVAGIALFTVASLFAGLAQSSDWLTIARAAQGIAAAVAVPSVLTLLMASFPPGPERGRAIAWYGAIAGGASSIGIVLGGLLTSWLSWRWAMFINVPVGAAVIALAPRYLPETDRTTGHFDLLGALTGTLGMTGIVYGFVRAGSSGWSDPGTITAFVAGAALLAAFLLTEIRAEQPIMPLRLFASRERSGAYLSRLLLVAGMFSSFFFLTQFLQGVRNFSAIEAGVAFLPWTVVLFGAVQVMAKVAGHFGGTRLLIAGLVTGLAGMVWVSRLSVGTAYFPGIAIPMLLLGGGLGIGIVTLTTRGIAGVAPDDSGAASGMLNVAQQIGASLGLGILTSVFATASRHASSHPAAGLDAKNEAAQALAHGVSAGLTGAAIFLGLALVVALASGYQRSAVASTVPTLRRSSMGKGKDRAPSMLERTDGHEVADGANADASGERIFMDESWSISDREDGGHVAVKYADGSD
jgi:EmrB/QacA subfamily drug resistance transporter